MYDVERLRLEEFPHSASLVYLNHAGISPLPQRARREVRKAIDLLSENPHEFFMERALPAMVELSEDLARFINAVSAAELVSTTSTSAALNAVAQAICWQPGDNVLFCDLEFPSNAYPWMSLERYGVEARRLPADQGGLSLQAVEQATDARTRVVAASAVQFFTGHRTDMVAIGRFCREHNILFAVDAIQAIGHMPFDVQSMHIDILATGGQKSLLALPGVGFLYVRESVAEAMRPRLIHSNATIDYLHWLAYDLTPLPGAARFAGGTPNVPGILGIAASLGLLNELGVANIDAHTVSLTRYACERLLGLGYEVITPLDAAGPIATFRVPSDSAATDKLVEYLASRRIMVAKHLDAKGEAYLRISFHCYNTPQEVDAFVEAFQEWPGWLTS